MTSRTDGPERLDRLALDVGAAHGGDVIQRAPSSPGSECPGIRDGPCEGYWR